VTETNGQPDEAAAQAYVELPDGAEDIDVVARQIARSMLRQFAQSREDDSAGKE
jgi:hypothetical protein